MDMYGTIRNAEELRLITDRLELKGKGILELCLEQGKNLCMKGFIDCQIEKGMYYLPVVERMVDHIDHQLSQGNRPERQALLLDLRNYAGAQLQNVHAAEQPGGW